MKALTILFVLMLIAPLAFAGNFWADTADVLTGRNPNLPFDVYVAKTLSLKDVPYVRSLNADLRIKVSTPVGSRFLEEGKLSVGLEF